MPLTVTLQYLAPIAINSEVSILLIEAREFSGDWRDSGYFIFDHHNEILYGPGWMPFDIAPEDIVEGRFERVDYRKKPSAPPVKARVLRCTVRSSAKLVETQFLLEIIKEDATPYRG